MEAAAIHAPTTTTSSDSGSCVTNGTREKREISKHKQLKRKRSTSPAPPPGCGGGQGQEAAVETDADAGAAGRGGGAGEEESSSCGGAGAGEGERRRAAAATDQCESSSSAVAAATATDAEAAESTSSAAASPCAATSSVEENALFDLPDLLLDLSDGLWCSPVWTTAPADQYDAGDDGDDAAAPLLWAEQCWMDAPAAPVQPD
ncbi:hypothetical protein OsI_08335 [Oryza sativa Indica Group]|uniref:Uncharacterized protein n=1 Tax=Oryza sativa subsp. indica TaxID=39946 RepID=A2X7Y9_ORYSI|nr:hypothetical protein OsI_08335 [Oryza sativa Indica Group]